MTKQEIFDTVVAHLLTQQKRAYKDMCLYRAPNGLKCAVGCLIPDDVYDRALEGMAADAFAKGGAGLSDVDQRRAATLVKRRLRLRADQADLLADLQCIHDDHDPREWERQLRASAREHRLRFNWPRAAT